MNEAAKAQLAGIPVMDVLTCHDQFQLLVYQAITQRVFSMMDEREDILATRIANAVAKMLGAR